jgi:hypothetical protein
MCVTNGARWYQIMHDSPCTTAAKHRETLRANGIEQSSPPTNLPQQIPHVPAGHCGQQPTFPPVFNTADNILDGLDVSGVQGPTITVSCRTFSKPEGLRNSKQIAVEIIVGDTGCGIPASKLESIFREFERVESAQPKTSTVPGLGLGLAVVARSVEQLGGQLRVDSKVDQGSRFSFLIPFMVWDGCGRHLVGQGGYRQTGAPTSHSSSPSSNLGADMSIKHEREVPDNRSVSPLPGQGVIDNAPVTPDSQMASPPEAVGVEVKAVGIKLRPRPSFQRRKTVHPKDRSPGHVHDVPTFKATQCSKASGRRFLATFGSTQNPITKPFTRTLRMVSSRQPTRFGTTNSYCGSAMDCV